MPFESRQVVVAGEVMVLLVGEPGVPLELTGTFRTSTAGAECNVAVGLCRLGHRARWLGRVGADPLGRAVLRRLRADGIDTASVRSDDIAPTGVLIRDSHPQRPIQVGYYRSGSAASRWGPADVRDDALDGADLLHLSGITPMLSATSRAGTERLVALAAANGVPISLDPNLRLRLGDLPRWREVLVPLLARADIVLAGADELDQLETTPHDLLSAGTGLVVVREPDMSATAHTPSEVFRRPAELVAAVDGVGAGDAFAAGFLSGQLEGLPVPACLGRAAHCAALAVQTVGDTEGLPYRDELLGEAAAGRVLR